MCTKTPNDAWTGVCSVRGSLSIPKRRDRTEHVFYDHPLHSVSMAFRKNDSTTTRTSDFYFCSVRETFCECGPRESKKVADHRRGRFDVTGILYGDRRGVAFFYRTARSCFRSNKTSPVSDNFPVFTMILISLT